MIFHSKGGGRNKQRHRDNGQGQKMGQRKKNRQKRNDGQKMDKIGEKDKKVGRNTVTTDKKDKKRKKSRQIKFFLVGSLSGVQS